MRLPITDVPTIVREIVRNPEDLNLKGIAVGDGLHRAPRSTAAADWCAHAQPFTAVSIELADFNQRSI